MDIQLKKGLLEAYVLSVLRRGPTYGYRLYMEINQGIPISESTLYPILRRLESQQCLETFQEEYEGRLRKYYVITPSGIIRFQEYVQMCREMKNIINMITKGE